MIKPYDQALDLSSKLLGRGNLPGASIVRLSKKDDIFMTKGEGIGSQTRVGMMVLVALEKERGEVDTYMVLSSYYYDMLAINDMTRHTTQKKNNTA
jgi:hypothetical protein